MVAAGRPGTQSLWFSYLLLALNWARLEPSMTYSLPLSRNRDDPIYPFSFGEQSVLCVSVSCTPFVIY